MPWNDSMTCAHVDTCLSSFLLDHHNREGELLLGVFIDGSYTYGDVLNGLLTELHDSTASIDPADLPGFDYDSAKAAAKSLFVDVHPMRMDRGLFDSSLDIVEADDMAEMVQAWFLFRWEENCPDDGNLLADDGVCGYCGNTPAAYKN